MLNRENRLKKRKEFGYIYKNGACVHSKYLTLLYTPSKLKRVRVGFSVSKKIGKAYLRNLVKRRLRAVVRENISHLAPKTNYIFVARAGIDALDYVALTKEINILLKKLGEKCNENIN